MIVPLAFPAYLEATIGFQTGTWTTTPEYRIDEPEGAERGFGAFSRLRVDATGTRLVVQDAEIVGAVAVGRILVYAPDGMPFVTLAPEDLPGGFGLPVGLRADADGFWIRDLHGTLKYSYDNANVIDSIMYPPDMGRVTPLDDGDLLTRGDVPHYDAIRDNPPPREQAVLRLTEAGDRWRRDTMAVLDIRHRGWFVGLSGQGSGGGTRVAYRVFSISQPFSDHDLTWFDSEAGSVGVVRRNGAAGAVEVFEVVAPGDTAWRRRVLVPTVPLTGERAEAAIEENLSRAPSADETEGLTDADLRRIVEDAMFIPRHLPTVVALVATVSGEVWLKTPEVSLGHTVWYSVRPGDDGVPPRRVLLPSTFKLQDAVGDILWGFLEEPLRPRRVVGLRLVPPPGPRPHSFLTNMFAEPTTTHSTTLVRSNRSYETPPTGSRNPTQVPRGLNASHYLLGDSHAGSNGLPGCRLECTIGRGSGR